MPWQGVEGKYGWGAGRRLEWDTSCGGGDHNNKCINRDDDTIWMLDLLLTKLSRLIITIIMTYFQSEVN